MPFPEALTLLFTLSMRCDCPTCDEWLRGAWLTWLAVLLLCAAPGLVSGEETTTEKSILKTTHRTETGTKKRQKWSHFIWLSLFWKWAVSQLPLLWWNSCIEWREHSAGDAWPTLWLLQGTVVIHLRYRPTYSKNSLYLSNLPECHRSDAFTGLRSWDPFALSLFMCTNKRIKNVLDLLATSGHDRISQYFENKPSVSPAGITPWLSQNIFNVP